ncbi:unnamed protein product [Moneuplotes crassus]|uniref:Transmembrane protein n=1 Tax=Euplotes crassus TaxID=5936 RepID=A0AAD1XSR4_EUPCR|nr:unnamed protein product [Moneuplotes crassus]
MSLLKSLLFLLTLYSTLCVPITASNYKTELPQARRRSACLLIGRNQALKEVEKGWGDGKEESGVFSEEEIDGVDLKKTDVFKRFIYTVALECYEKASDDEINDIFKSIQNLKGEKDETFTSSFTPTLQLSSLRSPESPEISAKIDKIFLSATLQTTKRTQNLKIMPKTASDTPKPVATSKTKAADKQPVQANKPLHPTPHKPAPAVDSQAVPESVYLGVIGFLCITVIALLAAVIFLSKPKQHYKEKAKKD